MAVLVVADCGDTSDMPQAASGCWPARRAVDIGLLVKNARGPVCVPDYAPPRAESGSGWQYSQALVGVLTAVQGAAGSCERVMSRLAQQ